LPNNEELLELAQNLEKLRDNFRGLMPANLLELVPDKDEVVDAALNYGKPEKQVFGVSARGGEVLVAAWLRWLQFESVTVTPERRDGGFDVIADDYLVQVKSWSRDWIGVAPVREIYGVAQAEGKLSMMWIKGTLSDDAMSFANKVKMPVFQFSPEEGIIAPGNEAAETLFKEKSEVRLAKYLAAQKHGVVKASIALLTASFNMFDMASEFFSDTFRDELLTKVLDLKGGIPSLDGRELNSILGGIASSRKVEDVYPEVAKLQVISEACSQAYFVFGDFLESNSKELTIGLSNLYGEALESTDE
jgi:hypothetical protein